MKVAIVCDWLVVYAGAERVLEEIIKLYPAADLFAVVDFLPQNLKGFILHKPVQTTLVQHLPFARQKYRSYLPLMPLAIEQLDLSGYDLVISSSHAVAKGVITGPAQLHICYMHSPMRYAWDLQHQYLRETKLDRGLKGWAARWLLHKMRMWDVRSANGVDHFVANSRFIARRIEKVYRRESTVIYPPVNVFDFPLCHAKEDFYLTASRMVPYKRMELIVQAFARMPDKKLLVVGDGPEYRNIKAVTPANVTLLGYQNTEVLSSYLQKAKAFVFAAEEDFGIVPVEAQACGTPVIAYGRGGALETVRGLDHPEPTGVFFGEQTADAIVDAVRRFEATDRIKAQNCRNNALKFSADRFSLQFSRLVESKLHPEKSAGKGLSAVTPDSAASAA